MPPIKKLICVTAVVGFFSLPILHKLPKSTRTAIQLHFTPLLPNEINQINLSLLQSDDYHSILNIKFHYTILKPICSIKTDAEPFLLMLVYSSDDHFEKRQLIRDTWGASSKTVRVAFLIGQSLKRHNNEKLKAESFRTNDILQGDFIDSYFNITYKHTMGMKYFIYHCSKAKYVLKVDDDVLVNTPSLLKFLAENISPNGAKNMILCNKVVAERALRSFRSKWRISFEEYPYRYYPTFCRGMAIIYSPDVLFNLYNRAQRNKKFFKLEDVFYTGIIAESIGYKEHSNIAHLMSVRYKNVAHDVIVPDNLKTYLFVGSELNEKDLVQLWNLLQRSDE